VRELCNQAGNYTIDGSIAQRQPQAIAANELDAVRVLFGPFAFQHSP